MALAGHQLLWAFALALGTPAAHEAPVVSIGVENWLIRSLGAGNAQVYRINL